MTLVEMAIVLATLGILASVALPLYLRYQIVSKTAEARSNLAAIRTVEPSHFSEFGAYLSASHEPPTIPGARSTDFTGVSGSFSVLRFSPEGSVYFSYGVAVSVDEVGFTADAGGDLDGDGVVQFWGLVKPDGSGAILDGAVGCDGVVPAPLQILPCSPASGRSVF